MITTFKKKKTTICIPSSPNVFDIDRPNVVCSLDSVENFLEVFAGIEASKIENYVTNRQNKKLPLIGYLLSFLCLLGLPVNECTACMTPTSVLLTETACLWMAKKSKGSLSECVTKQKIPGGSVFARLTKWRLASPMIFHRKMCVYGLIRTHLHGSTSSVVDGFLREIEQAALMLYPTLVNLFQQRMDKAIVYSQLINIMPGTCEALSLRDISDRTRSDKLFAFFKRGYECIPATPTNFNISLARSEGELEEVPVYVLLTKPRLYSDSKVTQGLVRLLVKELNE